MALLAVSHDSQWDARLGTVCYSGKKRIVYQQAQTLSDDTDQEGGGDDRTRLPPRYSTGIFDPIESLVLSVLTKKYASTCNSRRLARNRSADRPASRANANANAALESWGLLHYLLRSGQDMPSHDITLHDCTNL